MSTSGYQPIPRLRSVEGVSDTSDNEYEPIDGPQPTLSQQHVSAGSLRRMLTQISVLTDGPNRVSGDVSSNDKYYTSKIFISTQWLVLPIFLLIGLGSVVLIALKFTNVLDSYLGFAILVAITIVGGALGSLFVWRFGTVDQVVTQMALQNQWYEIMLQNLDKERKSLASETKKVAFEVTKLKKVSHDLKKTNEQFEELRQSLAEIAEEEDELLHMVETVNEMCDETERITRQNQRAQLLLIYYDLVSDHGEGDEERLALTKRDYERRFVGRLDKELRTQLENMGGFSRVDKDGDGTIDKEEFISMINEVLDHTQSQEERQLQTLKQLNYE